MKKLDPSSFYNWNTEGGNQWSNGLMVKTLGSKSRDPVLKVDSVFDSSVVDQISTRNFWELSGKK